MERRSPGRQSERAACPAECPAEGGVPPWQSSSSNFSPTIVSMIAQLAALPALEHLST